MKLLTKSNDEYAELGAVERVALGMGNFANAFVFVLIASFMTYYYTNVIGLNPAVIGTIMLVSRIFDGVTDLGFGWILDRTKTKFGRSRLWMLRVCIPFAIFSVVMFMVPVNASDTIKYIFVFVSYNITNAILYTALTVAYNSSMVSITRNQYERGLLSTFAVLFSGIANMIVTSTALKLVDLFGGNTSAWTKTVVIYAVIGLISHFICIFGIKERVQDEEAPDQPQADTHFSDVLKSLVSNKYWLMNLTGFCLYWIAYSLQFGSSLYYSENILGDAGHYAVYQNAFIIVNMIALAVLFIPLKKFGKAACHRAGTLTALTGYICLAVLPPSLPVVIAANVLHGIGMGYLCTCAVAMNADTLDYSEWKSGIRAAGMGTAVIGFSQKVGTGLGAAIMGYVLNMGGFDGTAAVQADSALTAVKATYTYIPLAIYIVIFLVMFRYDLDKRYTEVAEGLKGRK